jgi:hypothetical protein
MVNAVDEPVAESDAQQLGERLLGPFRVRDFVLSLEDFVGSQRQTTSFDPVRIAAAAVACERHSLTRPSAAGTGLQRTALSPGYRGEQVGGVASHQVQRVLVQPRRSVAVVLDLEQRH